MDTDFAFRYEKKYIVDNLRIANYRLRLDAVCDLDEHAKPKGYYSIRSLYFDDYFNNAYRDNADGLGDKDKWRLRVYDNNADFISLEHKIKRKGRVAKVCTAVSREFCSLLLGGGLRQCDYPCKDKVVNRFLFDCYTRGLRPVIIVDYKRTPYVFRDSDVRITFDENISYSGPCISFWEEGLRLTPLMAAGRQLMEVKYTEFFPSVLYRSLNMGTMAQTSFSKFYFCLRNERMEGAML